MAEVAEIHLPYPKADAKNLFIRDDKGAISSVFDIDLLAIYVFRTVKLYFS